MKVLSGLQMIRDSQVFSDFPKKSKLFLKIPTNSKLFLEFLGIFGNFTEFSR